MRVPPSKTEPSSAHRAGVTPPHPSALLAPIVFALPTGETRNVYYQRGTTSDFDSHSQGYTDPHIATPQEVMPEALRVAQPNDNGRRLDESWNWYGHIYSSQVVAPTDTLVRARPVVRVLGLRASTAIGRLPLLTLLPPVARAQSSSYADVPSGSPRCAMTGRTESRREFRRAVSDAVASVTAQDRRSGLMPGSPAKAPDNDTVTVAANPSMGSRRVGRDTSPSGRSLLQVRPPVEHGRLAGGFLLSTLAGFFYVSLSSQQKTRWCDTGRAVAPESEDQDGRIVEGERNLSDSNDNGGGEYECGARSREGDSRCQSPSQTFYAFPVSDGAPESRHLLADGWRFLG